MPRYESTRITMSRRWSGGGLGSWFSVVHQWAPQPRGRLAYEVDDRRPRARSDGQGLNFPNFPVRRGREQVRNMAPIEERQEAGRSSTRCSDRHARRMNIGRFIQEEGSFQFGPFARDRFARGAFPTGKSGECPGSGLGDRFRPARRSLAGASAPGVAAPGGVGSPRILDPGWYNCLSRLSPWPCGPVRGPGVFRPGPVDGTRFGAPSFQTASVT